MGRRSSSLCSLHSYKGKNLLENHAKRLKVKKETLLNNLKYDSRKTPFDQPSKNQVKTSNINFQEQINDIIELKAKKKMEWKKFESLCNQSLSTYIKEKEARKEIHRARQKERQKKSLSRQSSARTFLHSRCQSRPRSRVCVEAWSEMGRLTKENMFETPKDRADTVDSIKSRHQNWSTESGTQDPLDIDSRPLEVDITPWNQSSFLFDHVKTADKFDSRPNTTDGQSQSQLNQRMKDLIQIENIKTTFTNQGMYISRAKLERGLLVPDCKSVLQKTKKKKKKKKKREKKKKKKKKKK